MPKFSKLTWHKRTHGHEFTGAEFRVLMSIFDHSDEHGRKSHPGLKLLMAETGYGKTAVSEALTALQERGWITQTRKGSGTSGKTSVYELVPDAPSGTAEADQPRDEVIPLERNNKEEVGSVERTSWSAGADPVVPLEVVPLERTPTDPGSDPFGSDQRMVRYPPNHSEDQDETGLDSRSLTAEDSEATEETEGYRPEGLVGTQPSTAHGSRFDDPFSAESLRRHAEQAAEEAARDAKREAAFAATAGGRPASPWD